MNLTIDKKILDVCPNFNIISYLISFNDDYDVMTKSSDVSNLLLSLKEECLAYNYDQITSIPRLKETRDLYKSLGKDPSHTKPACESLIRRLVKGEDLYRLGDVIDLGNALSVRTLRSVCVVDSDKLNGDVYITVGEKELKYEGIGRGIINAANLVIYKDNIGIFGSPTSDTNRTKVTNSTKNILVMIICASSEDLEQSEHELLNLYKSFTNIKSINKLS